MGYHIRHRESPEDAVRRVAMTEVRSSIDNLRSRHPTPHEAVHDFRKSCKKLRGLLRLVRGELGDLYAPENRFYRDLSRELSHVRDSQALIEAVDRLSAHFGSHETPLPDLSEIRDYLVHLRDHSNGGEAALLPQLDAIAKQLDDAAHRIETWQFADKGFDCFAFGLSANYRRARRGMQRCLDHPTSTNFHEWRKRVKYHWHHGILLRKTCRRILKPHIRMTEALGELLGQYQDYSVLRARISDVQSSVEFDEQRHRLMQLINIRQKQIRKEAFYVGSFVLVEKPRRLADRWEGYWNAWNASAKRPS